MVYTSDPGVGLANGTFAREQVSTMNCYPSAEACVVVYGSHANASAHLVCPDDNGACLVVLFAQDDEANAGVKPQASYPCAFGYVSGQSNYACAVISTEPLCAELEVNRQFYNVICEV